MKKNDIILIVALIIISLVSLLGIKWYQGLDQGAKEVIIKHQGQVIETFPFTEKTDEIYSFVDGDELNTIVIKNGLVSITEASCRDQICVKTKSISQNGEIIVCLPHQLTVEIFADHVESELDSIAE